MNFIRFAKLNFSILIISTFLVSCSTQRVMQGNTVRFDHYEYSSVGDFSVISSDGYVPAYVHEEKGALAIDAAIYKKGYAGAAMTFTGASGAYNLTLHTLLETDGESTYQILRNGLLIGELRNPATIDDYKPHSFRLSTVNLLYGDKIEVRFNTHSNGLIPEGDEHAYARGRWTGITLHRR